MATIPITDKLRLQSDRHCWHLQRLKVTKKGESSWVSELYFAKLRQALAALPEHVVKASGASTVAEAIAEAQGVSDAVSRAFSGHIRIDLE